MESLSTSARNLPKMSFPTLEVRKNYYVIPDGRQFHYFPVKISGESDDRPIFRFEKAPPVLMEGIAIVGRKLYRVPIQDLMRGVIRKHREIKPAKRVTDGSTGNANPATTQASEAGANALAKRRRNAAVPFVVNQPGAGDGPEVEVGEDADAAWEEQIDSLLSFMAEKEGVEWEVSDSAQPGSANESRAVPDPQGGSGEG